MPDLYEILGVRRDADGAEIKKAYRRRARECHPDTGGDEDEFKQVTHAYQVLSDPDSRSRYDRFGDDGTPGTRGAGDPFGAGAGFGGIGDVIDAFFGSAFGGGAQGRGRTRTRTQPGRDVLVPTEITLEEVATGLTRPVEVEVAAPCDQCGGSGSASGGVATGCTSCGGTGQVQRVVRTAFGQLATASACPTCAGTGTNIQDPCPGCAGEGRRVQKRRITVEIPAGVDDGDRLRVRGAGEAGRHGAPSGDLFVEVRVAEHELFQRDGRDLWADVTVPLVQAALGSKLSVPTVNGDEVETDLPAGTQPGEVLTMRRAGLPTRGGGRPGDLHLRVQVEVPTELDREQRELLERLAQLRGEEMPASGRGLFSRFREALR